MNLQTVDYLVHRLRDVKVTVRAAVLTALQTASITAAATAASEDDTGGGGEPLLQSRHLAEIVTAGFTDRYVQTICCRVRGF